MNLEKITGRLGGGGERRNRAHEIENGVLELPETRLQVEIGYTFSKTLNNRVSPERSYALLQFSTILLAATYLSEPADFLAIVQKSVLIVVSIAGIVIAYKKLIVWKPEHRAKEDDKIARSCLLALTNLQRQLGYCRSSNFTLSKTADQQEWVAEKRDIYCSRLDSVLKAAGELQVELALVRAFFPDIDWQPFDKILTYPRVLNHAQQNYFEISLNSGKSGENDEEYLDSVSGKLFSDNDPDEFGLEIQKAFEVAMESLRPILIK